MSFISQVSHLFANIPKILIIYTQNIDMSENSSCLSFSLYFESVCPLNRTLKTGTRRYSNYQQKNANIHRFAYVSLISKSCANHSERFFFCVLSSRFGIVKITSYQSVASSSRFLVIYSLIAYLLSGMLGWGVVASLLFCVSVACLLIFEII